MSNSLHALLAAIALPLLFLPFSCMSGQPLPRDPSELIGQPAPDLSFTPVQNTDHTSLSSLRGRTVVLELWATWCGPCRESLPMLDAAFRPYGGNPFFLAINVDARSADREESVRSFIEQHAPRAPVVLDDGRAVGLFAARAIPFTAIIDPQGMVRHVHVGVIDPAELVELALRTGDAPSLDDD